MLLYDEISKLLRMATVTNNAQYLPDISPIVENAIKNQIKDDVRVVAQFADSHAAKLLKIEANNDTDFFLKFIKVCEDCKSTKTKRRFIHLYESCHTRIALRASRVRKV